MRNTADIIADAAMLYSGGSPVDFESVAREVLTAGQAAPARQLERLLARWQFRALEALPIDAMLINKHVRELREALAGQLVEKGETS